MDAEPQLLMMPGCKRQNHRPMIGLLIQSSAASPQLELEWRGVVEMARDQDANLICFIGGSLNSPHDFKAQANILYDLVNPEQLDGLVIWTSNVGSYLTPEQVKEFLGRFHPLPIVSGTYVVPGIPSVLQSNTQGMREAVVHLSKVHGCRRIAFLRGPEKNFGAQERYQAYIDTLAEQGLPYSSNLISPPVDWLEGTIAMAALLDERKLRPAVDFDAIVAASDDLMLAAMTTLQARGIRVPSQVAIIGCDNSAFCKIAIPPLTSVVTPSYELGRQAVLLLLAQIHGEQIPEQTFVPGELIVRQSCGCLSSLAAQAIAGPVTPVDESLETALSALSERREHILNEMQRVVGTGEPARAWAGSLLDSFAVEMTGGTRHVFLRELEEILNQVTSSGGDILTWQNALSVLRRQLLPYLETESRARAEDLWQQARVAAGEAAAQSAARRAYHAEQHAQTLREFGAALITTFDVDELMNVLAQGLPRLGIPSCYLAVYKDPQQPAEWSRLLLAYNEHGRIPIKPNGLHFPSRQLVPEDFLPQDRRYDLTIEPLYFRENQLGYIVFEVGPLEASIYEALRAQISSALHGALLVQRVQQRTYELAASNQRLETVATLSGQLNSILDFDRLLSELVTLTKETFNYYHVHIYLFDRENQTLALKAGYGQAGAEMKQRGHQIDLDASSLVARAARNRQVVQVDNVQQSPDWLPNPLLPDTRSEMAVPIIASEGVVGVLDVQSDRLAGLDRSDRDLLQSLANQMAVALTNAGLFQEVLQANTEIQTLNERLKSENMRMEAELDVTRRLQQMLLPGREELALVEGLDIAGFMQPADEVGGDYYDVLRVNDRIKIGIGDVTGHGLESGVVMLMVQTAVRTLLTVGVYDPLHFMDILNRVLYANLQRMDVEKSMSLTLLDYQRENGQMSFSGQHEQVLIVRQNGQVEVKDTLELGFPMGLVEDIGGFLGESDIILLPGDGVVLFSDGFTEAEDVAGEFYGLERLCRVVSENWHEPVEVIKSEVVADVQRFIGKHVVYDDLALLVIKQKNCAHVL